MCSIFLKDNNYITHKMRGIVFIQVVVFLLISMTGYGQQKKFNIHTVAFYYLENLFDTINDPTKYD